MKYKIGQILYPGWVDDDDIKNGYHKCEIVAIAILGDFSWKYVISDEDEEYSNTYGIIDEQEIEKEYIIVGGEE